jgi:hypothetical protein
MPIHAYSYKFKKIMPLLNETEFAEIRDLLNNRIQEYQIWRKKTGRPLDVAELNSTPSSIRALEYYRQLTGIELDDVELLKGLRAADYGKPCPKCKNPMRTPSARYCAFCGNTLPNGQKIGGLIEKSSIFP